MNCLQCDKKVPAYRLGSEFCSPKCERRHRYEAYLVKHEKKPFRPYHKDQPKSVTIIDPMVAVPYSISMSEYQRNKNEYKKLGVEVVIA